MYKRQALDGVLAKIEKDFPGEAYALTVLNAKFQSFVKPGMGADAALEALVKEMCIRDSYQLLLKLPQPVVAQPKI